MTADTDRHIITTMGEAGDETADISEVQHSPLTMTCFFWLWMFLFFWGGGWGGEGRFGSGGNIG